MLVFLLLICFIGTSLSSSSPSVLVVGSVNADIIVPIDRLPNDGETIVSPEFEDGGKTIAGGKGANQAVGVARLTDAGSSVFMCSFGNDANAAMLEKVLKDNHVNVSYCRKTDRPSGLGIVLLTDTGAASAIVVGGANSKWPTREIIRQDIIKIITEKRNIACILLQMEIPQVVNDVVAEVAEEYNVPVFQDVGGEEREIPASHLRRCTFLSPNLSELKRLTKMDCESLEEIIDAAKELQKLGGRNILVTLGSEGSLLLTENGEVIKQDAIKIEKVVDETGCGDNFRAAFVAAHFCDKKTIKESLLFSSAAGSSAATKLGAIPSMSTREEINSLLSIRGGSSDDDDFPYLFASRLNSMKDRMDLCKHGEDKGVPPFNFIARQGRIKGLSLVDFNYPQHITSPIVTSELKEELMSALNQAGLRMGAVCLRFPKEFQAGAFTNPSAELRKRAIQLTKEACEWSIALGANEVVVWSAYCGYDYPLQANYNDMSDMMVEAFQEVCDAYPHCKISLEFKPTDENTRFFAIASTGSAHMLSKLINRDNFGLTLDFGHCLFAGENPAQSVASVGRDGKLFGVQLGDGYSRLGAEDGLAFGSINTKAALEFVYWLIKTNYKGHIYFDTFPRNEDPIREAEYNIRQFKKMYKLAKSMITGKDSIKIEEFMKQRDAMSILEYLENNLENNSNI